MLKNNKGFTLIEMLIVLMIISVLIILIVPNLGQKGSEVHSKGCEALVSVVQSQVDAYYIDHNTLPGDLTALVDESYINEDQRHCPNGEELRYNIDEESGTGIVSPPSEL
ncbi:competence type IV pilus major pilin ComGC [Oceanobacillus massiliensis]|uniref:competence type IV pilus major pilin ComGC n=1 Tax=Oceanobacillus massiliensis TaxID=1465765 RepID=UPI0030179A36